MLHLRAILSSSRMPLQRFVMFSTQLGLRQCKLPIIFISKTQVACTYPNALLIGYLIKIKLMDCPWFINAFHCPEFWIVMEEWSEFPFSCLINVGNVQFGRKLTILSMRPSCTGSEGHKQSSTAQNLSQSLTGQLKKCQCGPHYRMWTFIMFTPSLPLITKVLFIQKNRSFPGKTDWLSRWICTPELAF